MKIIKSYLEFVREPLVSPFGFKGAYVSELWQTVAGVKNADGVRATGIGVQSVLWSDATVFKNSTVVGGNLQMLMITEYALKLLEGTEFETPVQALSQIKHKVYEYAKQVTNNSKLRPTFALNALVCVDNALWQLYAKENNTQDFLSLVPKNASPALNNKQEKLCNIPLITYGIPVYQIRELVNDGFFFLKIKIGSDPDKDGSREKMLEWDKNRLLEIHNAVKDIKTPYTESGHIPYYLDANGRYDSKQRLNEFLKFAESIGALDRIMILEEPFPEEIKIDVSDIPVRIAADESAHSQEDVEERIGLGYTAIALKPIAKTMSESFNILARAHEKNIPCFCADLTVNPVMVEWNKNIAARMDLFPGMKIGILESNGAQNYSNWEKMKSYHSMYKEAGFLEARNGCFELDDEFYKTSGGIFTRSDYYDGLVEKQD